MIELHECVAAETDDATLEHAIATGDELAVRDLLARIAAADAERERLKRTRDEIVDRYDEKIAALYLQAQRHRESVQAFLIAHNGGESVSFPDVGTAYLQNRQPKLRLADAGALEGWLHDQGLDSDSLYRQVFDAKAALTLVQGEGGRFFLDTERNVLVNRETGEIVEVEGVEVVPASQSLAIRRAA